MAFCGAAAEAGWNRRPSPAVRSPAPGYIRPPATSMWVPVQ